MQHSIKEKDEVKDVAISANDNFIITGGKGKILKICSVNDQGITYNRDLGGNNNYKFVHQNIIIQLHLQLVVQSVV